MSKLSRRWALLALALTTLTAFIWRVSVTRFDPSVPSVSVELPAAGGEVVARFVSYDQSGVKLSMRVEFATGESEFIFYRANGTVSGSQIFYPPAVGTDAHDYAVRQIKEKLVFADDGFRLISEEHYYPEGEIEKLGQRLAGGEYEVHQYFLEGGIAAHSIVDKSGFLVSSEVYREDGSVQESTKRLANRDLETVIYTGSGLVAETHVERSDGREVRTYFYEDGQTVRLRFTEGGMYTLGEYYSFAGTITLKVAFDAYNNQTVTVYDTSGSPLYQQYWSRGGSRLDRLEEYGRDGTVIRTVNLDDGAVNQEIIPARLVKPVYEEPTVPLPDPCRGRGCK